MNVLIIAGGNPPSSKLLKEKIKNCDFIICADRGAECLYYNGIVPDYLLGDFDSIDKKILIHYKNIDKCKIITFNKDKDDTDTGIAFNKAVELGATNITFLGTTGTRVDHMLGNIGLLKKCNEMGINGCIKDNNNEVYLLEKPIEIEDKGYIYFSLHAYCNIVKSLSITNCKFELHDYDLCIGDSRTVSNEFIGGKVQINFNEGRLLLIYSKD